MERTAAPVIIIKKKKRGHDGHHGGAWKVAYADFVTAMMALFIVLWLLSSSEQVKKSVGGYFSDPTGAGKEVGNGMRGSGRETLGLHKDDMAKLKEELEQAVAMTAKIENLNRNIEITVTGEGLRVQLMEDEKGTFFESGNALPTGSGKDILKTLAAEIGKLPNKITVEGHTDSRPFLKQAGYSNWELSSDRANAARHLMQENGVRADQVSQVRGFADQSLREPKDPENPSNRRITVIVLYQNPETDKGAKSEGAGKDKHEAPKAEAHDAEKAPPAKHEKSAAH